MTLSMTAFALAAVLLGGACGWIPDGDKRVPVVARVPPPESSETVDPKEATFTMYVSNQSFREPRIHITITIDGKPIVAGRFAVEGQHNWIAYPLKLKPGSHQLSARAESGVTFKTNLEIPAKKARYGVLQYWNYEGEPKRFTWEPSETPPMFG